MKNYDLWKTTPPDYFLSPGFEEYTCSICGRSFEEHEDHSLQDKMAPKCSECDPDYSYEGPEKEDPQDDFE